MEKVSRKVWNWNQKKNRKPRSLKRRLVVFTFLCWVVPIVLLFLFATVSYREGIIKKTEKLIEDQLVNAAVLSTIRIEEAINICKRPSYEKTCELAWRNYRTGKMSRMDYISSVDASLRGKFYLDNRFRLYAFYENGGKKPACYSSQRAVSREDYTKEVNDYVEKWVTNGTDYAHVEIINQRIYVMRNLYTTSEYEYFGTLVVELNKEKIFKDIPDDQRKNMVICIDDPSNVIDYVNAKEGTPQDILLNQLMNQYQAFSNGTVIRESNKVYNGYLYQKKFDHYNIGIAFLAEKREIYSSLYDLYQVEGIMLLMFIPIIVYVVYFMNKQVQEPIKRLMNAAEKMEEGNIGIKVKGGSMPNEEFDYLRESFDSMSTQVKELFEYVYDETLARKDAQILALQAQINPHFLNNTLEMMNWQARMNGDVIVSKMIESLGTVLDYGMNRADVKEIYLTDELRCTDAYFYIMSMRFGQRLAVEREIDQELLYLNVPPLILQPLVENAIVHGVEQVKSGTIKLHIYHDEDKIYLRVSNTGKPLEPEEEERIRAILGGDKDKIPKGKGKHTSIGIRNVNNRIKLVYGEEYGLTITREGEETVSAIVLPYRK
ncbi:MAG: histidine kinase [Lachnospiraceae bacterium]